MQAREAHSTGDRGGSLAGKAGVVTGAASGLGLESARLLGERGAAVVLADLDGDALQRATATLAQAGISAVAAPTDVRDPAQVRRALELSRARFGSLDFVHNNAGVLVTRSLLDVEQVDLDQMWAVNVNGTFWGCRHAVELMRAQGSGGAIVNTASILAHHGDPVLPVYTATKHAILGLTRAISVDPQVAEAGIRVNCVCPGDMDTPLNDRYFASLPDPAAGRAAIEGAYPGKRMAQPREMATAVAFLLSDEASFISGTSLTVDAGLTANAY